MEDNGSKSNDETKDGRSEEADEGDEELTLLLKSHHICELARELLGEDSALEAHYRKICPDKASRLLDRLRNDAPFKIGILGPTQSGKSSFLRSLLHEPRNNNYLHGLQLPPKVATTVTYAFSSTPKASIVRSGCILTEFQLPQNRKEALSLVEEQLRNVASSSSTSSSGSEIGFDEFLELNIFVPNPLLRIYQLTRCPAWDDGPFAVNLAAKKVVNDSDLLVIMVSCVTDLSDRMRDQLATILQKHSKKSLDVVVVGTMIDLVEMPLVQESDQEHNMLHSHDAMCFEIRQKLRAAVSAIIPRELKPSDLEMYLVNMRNAVSRKLAGEKPPEDCKALQGYLHKRALHESEKNVHCAKRLVWIADRWMQWHKCGIPRIGRSLDVHEGDTEKLRNALRKLWDEHVIKKVPSDCFEDQGRCLTKEQLIPEAQKVVAQGMEGWLFPLISKQQMEWYSEWVSDLRRDLNGYPDIVQLYSRCARLLLQESRVELGDKKLLQPNRVPNRLEVAAAFGPAVLATVYGAGPIVAFGTLGALGATVGTALYLYRQQSEAKLTGSLNRIGEEVIEELVASITDRLEHIEKKIRKANQEVSREIVALEALAQLELHSSQLQAKSPGTLDNGGTKPALTSDDWQGLAMELAALDRAPEEDDVDEGFTMIS